MNHNPWRRGWTIQFLMEHTIQAEGLADARSSAGELPLELWAGPVDAPIHWPQPPIISVQLGRPWNLAEIIVDSFRLLARVLLLDVARL